MDNPCLLDPIDNKIVISNNGNYLGSGVKTFKVNRSPVNEIQVCHGNSSLATAGCYITESTGNLYQLGAYPVLTSATARPWELFGNSVGTVNNVLVVGIDSSNNQIEEIVAVNGTAISNTVNNYKCVNNISVTSGNMIYSGRTITCRPSGAGASPTTLPNVRIQLGGDFILNPLFMVGRKNGRSRKARLVAIDGSAFATANSNIALHVFGNNAIASGTLGLYNTALRIYDIPISNTQPIFFGSDSVVELSEGEQALFFKESTTTTTFLTWHWEIYYVE